jgi:catecholate siderophore receptor
MTSRFLRLLASTSPVALALSGTLSGASAQSAADSAALQLAPVSVEAEDDSYGYKTNDSALTKLTGPLLDTPQTVTTVPQQVIEDQGATTLRDTLRNVPGISLAAGEFGAQGDSLTIRGFTARSDIYIDGMRDFGSYYRDPFYLDGVEVLKGPSSILFGRGSTGGVVEQNSKQATLEPLTAGTFGLGTDATKRITADVDRPLSDSSALRLNVMGQDGGVAGRDEAWNDRLGLAGSLAMGLGTPTRVTLDYLHQTEYDTPDYGLPWLYEAGNGNIAKPAPLGQTGSNYYGFDNGNFLRTNVDIATAKVEHDVNDHITLKDQFRFGHYARQFRITEPQIFTAASASTPGGSGTAALLPAGTPLSAITVSRNELTGTSLETDLDNDASATIKFRTGFVEHTLVGGIELIRETSDPTRFTTIGPYSQTPLLDPDPSQPYNSVTYKASETAVTAFTEAGYFLDTLKFDRHWQLMAGGRFDRFDAHYGQVTFNNPVTGTGAGSTHVDHVDEMPSWRAALVYKPVENGSIYVDAGTSFDPSAESLSFSASTADLSPEKNESYEIGSKWALFHNRLLLTGALYHTEQTNVRETDPDNSALTVLAGDALAEGFEFEAAGEITERWQISTGYAYTYSAIDKSPTTGVTSDLGHRLANVPMHTVNLWTTYRLPHDIEIGGGLNYVSSRYANSTPTVVGGVPFWKEAPGYWTADLMAKYPLTETLSLQMNLYNLTDADYYDQIHPSHVVPGAGRTALFTLSYRS